MKKSSQIKKSNPPDWILFVTILILCIIGIFLVGSSSWPESIKDGGNGYTYLKRHLVFLAMGLVVMGIAYKFPLSYIRKMSGILWVISLGFCLLLFTSLAVSAYGSARWLRIPGIGIQFMPSDLLKHASVIFFAHLIALSHGQQNRNFGALLFVLIISVGIVVLRDFSTAAVIGTSMVFMLFVAGLNLIEGLIILFGGLLGAGAMIVFYPYRVTRLLSFLDPFDDIANTDWQLSNSLYAFGLGGIKGVGFLQSRQRFSYIPEAYNDFIFAVLGEEFGLIGTVIVTFLFLVIIFRGYRIAFAQQDVFKKILAIGITTSLGVQAFFNIGVTIGIFPVTGITLPFISYGGTSLILSLGMSGILLQLSKYRGVQ